METWQRLYVSILKDNWANTEWEQCVPVRSIFRCSNTEWKIRQTRQQVLTLIVSFPWSQHVFWFCGLFFDHHMQRSLWGVVSLGSAPWSTLTPVFPFGSNYLTVTQTVKHAHVLINRRPVLWLWALFFSERQPIPLQKWWSALFSIATFLCGWVKYSCS